MKENLPKKIVEVVAALIRNDRGRYLIGQRPQGKAQGGHWEFVGGKIEPGETAKTAIERECKEELNCRVCAEFVLHSIVHEYPEKTIRLTFVACKLLPGEYPEALEHQKLAWVKIENYKDLESIDFCPADLMAAKFFFFGERTREIEKVSMKDHDETLFWIVFLGEYPELLPCHDNIELLKGWSWQTILRSIKHGVK